MMKRMLFFSLLAMASLPSCGNNIGGMQTYNCCINKQFYVCPDQDTFTECFNNGNPKDCTREESKDIGCPVSY